MNPLQLIIFDFDGTLVDTATDICEAVNVLFESEGHPRLSEDQIRPEIGMGLRSLLFSVFPEALEDLEKQEFVVQRLHHFYEDIHLNNAKLYPGVREFLDWWPEKIAILSNKPERYIHSLVKHLKLDDLPWQAIVGGDTYEQKKPHPLPFQEVMKKAQVSDHQACLMIGDGEPDMTGAQRMGIRPVAVEFGYGPVEELRKLGAWKTIPDFEELRRLAMLINQPPTS